MSGKTITNTSEEAINNPLLGLMASMNIEGQERNGQSQLVNSCQLPSRLNGLNKENGSAFEQYAKMGIKVIKLTKGDEMFCEVELPEGWSKKSTSHAMWSNLVDHKGRIRASIFYKAAFYDREAFINFERRFSINVITYLPSDQKGHYEKQKVKVPNPNYRSKNKLRDELHLDENGEHCIIECIDGYYKKYHYFGKQPKFITEEQNVWIPKYKDSYDEHNNTPMYFEITDCGKVIKTTQDDPVFFKRKYKKEKHEKWWKDYEHVTDRLRTQAVLTLKEQYPDYENINAYWN